MSCALAGIKSDTENSNGMAPPLLPIVLMRASPRMPAAPSAVKDIYSILIVSADPFHREFEAVLVTALWSEIEIVVGAIEHIHAARVARISVEHLTTVILVEDADSNLLRQRIGRNLVIVIRLALSDLLRRKRNLVVEIEIASVGRNPREAPAHALLVSLNLRQWGP